MSFQKTIKIGDQYETPYGLGQVVSKRGKDNTVVLELCKWSLAQKQHPRIYVSNEAVKKMTKVDKKKKSNNTTNSTSSAIETSSSSTSDAVTTDTTTADDESPKFPGLDLKMPLTLGIIYFTRQYDLTVEENLNFARMCLGGAVAFTLLSYLIVFLRISMKSSDKTPIWVPPKAKPAIPFQPPPPAPEPSEYEQTTYYDYEMKLLREACTQGGMSLGIAVVMSFKFNIHMSVMLQSAMLPYSIWDVKVCRTNLGLASLFSSEKHHYGEVMAKPAGAIESKKDR